MLEGVQQEMRAFRGLSRSFTGAMNRAATVPIDSTDSLQFLDRHPLGRPNAIAVGFIA